MHAETEMALVRRRAQQHTSNWERPRQHEIPSDWQPFSVSQDSYIFFSRDQVWGN